MGWFDFMRNKQGDESHVPKSSKAPPRTGSLQSGCLPLEQRLMFDAAAAATAAEVAGEAVAQEQADAAVSADGSGESSAQESGESHEVVEALTTFLPEPSPAEVVFVDPTVPDYATLLAGIDPNIEVVMLDGGQDGIMQMADVLSGRTGVDAIHLISHGEAGTLQLGTGILTVETMSGRYAEELSTIRQALSEQADILVYGCDFAAGETGQAAVDSLAQLTGADVQASSDLTGHASLGGDWELEVQTGAIETRIAIDIQEQIDWMALLAAPQLDATKTPTLDSVLEDAGAPAGSVGTLVSTLVDFATPSGQVDNVSDVDGGAQLGIAIAGANTTNGTWWYSTNNGATWNALGSVSEGSARLLAADASTRIYFQANANYNGTMSDAITFHAWDQTSGSNGGTANLTTTSTVRDEFNAVSYSNNDGTINWGGSWQEIGEGDGTSSGTVVVNSYAGLSGNSLQLDTDFVSYGVTRQVDLSEAASATLSFDYIRQHGGGINGAVSVDVYNGSAWTRLQTFAINATDATAQSYSVDISAYANANTQVRFIVSGSDSMGRLHVDNIQVTATDSGGGTSAYSRTSDTAVLTVTPVNDAPVLADTVLTQTVAEDGLPIGAVGNVLSDFTGGITDVDGGAVKGLAIVGYSKLHGSWYYTTNGGTTWAEVDTVSDTSALLLADNASTRLYFSPNPNYSGTSPAILTVRAWDQTSGAAGMRVSTVSNGGTTAFSSATDTIDVTVTAVNDAPSSVGGSVIGIEDTARAFSWSEFNVTDVDTAIGADSAVRVSTLPSDGTVQYYNGSTWLTVSVNQVLTKSTIDAGHVRFVPDANESGYDGYGTSGVGNGLQTYARFNFIPVQTTAISITNPGGESQTIAENSWIDPATGWTTSGADAGAQNLTAVDFANDHDNSLYVNAGGTLSQTLGTTFDSSKNYSLSFEVGWRGSAGYPAPPDFRVELWAGGTRLGYADQTAVMMVKGSFVSGTLAIDGASFSAFNGQSLQVHLVGISSQVDFDNLALTSFAPATDIGSVATMSVDVTPVDDAPSVTTSSGSVQYNENAFPVVIDAGVTLSDVDSATMTGATVQITAAYNSAQDVLAFTNQLGITGSWDSGTGILTLSGSATVANYQTALRSITYQNTSDNPTLSVRSVSFTVGDGTLSSTAATREVQVVAWGDAPETNDVSVSGPEDAAAIAVTLTGSDVDGTVANFRVDSLPANGMLYRDADCTIAAVTGTDYAATGNAVTLYFKPTADWNGTTTFQFSAKDDWGAYDATPGTATITVTPVNDTPTDLTLSANTVAENAANGTVVGTVSGTDPDSGETKTYSILDSAGGRFAIDSSTGQLTVADGSLLNYEAATSHTVTVRVTDRGGLTYDESFTITVTDINDAPTIANLSGDWLSYNEGDGAVVVDQGANALVADVDSANFDTGTLIVSIPVGAAPAEDVLSIRNQGTGAGQIGVSGSSVTYGGVVIGTFTGGAGGHNLAIRFNGNATPSAVTAVVQNITYEDIETGAPAEGGFTIRFGLTDGDGGASANYDVSVYLSGVNDAPVLADTALTLTVAEDAGAPSGAVGSLVSAWTGGVTDVDGGASKGIAVTGTDETHGTWYYTTNGGSTWTAIGAVSNTSALLLADNGSTRLYFSPRADYNGTSSAALTVRAWDRTSGSAGSKVSTVSNGGTTAFSRATDIVDVTVTPVNDAPTDVSLSANTVAENATNGTVVGMVSSTDPDGGDTKSYSLTDTAGGRFAIDSSTGQLTVADGSLLNYEAATSYTVTVRVTDRGGLTYDETFTINVTNVNEAPMGPDATLTLNEDTARPLTVADFGFSDVDAGDSLSAVRIDRLPGAGSLTLSGVNVTAGQVIAVADITAGSLVFTPAADAHGTGYASLTFSVRDTGGLYASAPNTLTFDVTAVHDAPVNTVPGAQTINEDTALALSGISVNDVDGNLSTVQLGVGNGTVSVTLQGTATISAGSNGSSTLTLSGSQVDINATLATLVYQGSAHFNGADTLTVTSTDTNSGTDVDTVAITVTAQNDAPTLSVNTGSTAAEGGTDTITVSELAVTDVDNSAAQLTYSIGTGPTYGRLELTTAPGISATTFTQADIAANRLVYVHDGSESIGDNFTFTVSDGAGGSLGPVSVTLTIMPANDAPTIMSNGGGAAAAINVAEHVSAVTIVGGVDVDLPAQTLTYSISGGIDQARFTIDAVTGALEFSVPPDFEVPTDADGDHVYVVEVRVTDSQGGTVTQTLHVTVTDVYESRPPAALPPSLVPTLPPADPAPTPAAASSTPDAIAPVVKPVVPDARVSSGESGIRAAQQAFGSGAFRPEDLRSSAPSTQREGPQARPVDQPLPVPLMYSVEDVHVDELEKPLSSAVLSELLFVKLDAVIEELEEAVAADAAQQVQVTRIAAATGVTLSVGFVAWALRSTVLLASLFGTLPAWQSLDPLPVLASHRSERKKSKAALEYVAREEQAEYRGLHELLDRKGERVPGSAEA